MNPRHWIHSRLLCLALTIILVPALGTPSVFAWPQVSHLRAGVVTSPLTTAGAEVAKAGAWHDLFGSYQLNPEQVRHLKERLTHGIPVDREEVERDPGGWAWGIEKVLQDVAIARLGQASWNARTKIVRPCANLAAIE